MPDSPGLNAGRYTQSDLREDIIRLRMEHRPGRSQVRAHDRASTESLYARLGAALQRIDVLAKENTYLKHQLRVEVVGMDHDIQEQRMNRVLDTFEESFAVKESEGGNWFVRRDLLFEQAVFGFFLICLDRAVISAPAWSNFCERVFLWIDNSRWAWDYYIDRVVDKAIHSVVQEWDSWIIACEYRSSVQFIVDELDELDELDGKSLLDSSQREALEEADDNFRSFAPFLISPRPPLPRGIPEKHWWWFLPVARSHE